jgi:hypothetical protein
MRSMLVVMALATVAHADPARDVTVESDPDAGQRHVAEGLALGGVGLEIAALALGVHERFAYDTAVATGDRDAANHAWSVTRYADTSLFLGGAALLGTAAYLAWSARDRELVHKTILVPSTDGGSVGMLLHGEF